MQTITAQLKAQAKKFLAAEAKRLVERALAQLATQSFTAGSFTPYIQLLYKGDELSYLMKLMLDLLPPDVNVTCTHTAKNDNGELVHDLVFRLVSMGEGGRCPYDFLVLYLTDDGRPQNNYEHVMSLKLIDASEEHHRMLHAYEEASVQLLEIQRDDYWSHYDVFMHHVLCWVIEHPDHGLDSFQPVADAYYGKEIDFEGFPEFLDDLNGA